MAQFVWYIINLDKGTVEGTNNVDIAEHFIEDESVLLLHHGGSYCLGSRIDSEVEEIEDPRLHLSAEEDDE